MHAMAGHIRNFFILILIMESELKTKIFEVY